MSNTNAKTAPESTCLTWLAQAFAENPDQVFSIDPFDKSVLLIDPARNSRGSTPEIGDKSLNPLIEDIETIGQTTACFTILNSQGVAELYAGFRRARAVQTLRQAQIKADGDAGHGTVDPWLLRAVITPGILTPQEIFERSLSENVFREGMTIMQKVSALEQLTGGEPGFGLTVTAAAKKMNMSKASASIYLRFSLLPSVAKRALNTFNKEGNPKLPYSAAESYVALLPSSKEMEDEPEEAAGALLSKAQEKIAALVEKELAKHGKVTGAAADKATRKTVDAGGKQANTKQRRSSMIISEVDEELEKAKTAGAEALGTRLAAIRKYVNGGSLKAMVKALAE